MFDIENVVKNIKKIIRKELIILWIFSFILSSALVALSLKNKFPLGKGDFVFLSILALLVSLYRPRWIFFLFVGLIPIDNVILVSGFLPMQLRPYQFLEAILSTAIIILLAAGRLGFRILKPVWQDYLVFSLVPLSFLSVINAFNRDISIKNGLILMSFIVLYFLIRNFVRSRKDLGKIAFFFSGSFLAVSGYGYFQILADKFGAKSFEVMFGRPNSTFTEPDWMGVYLCFALAVFLSLAYFFIRQKPENSQKNRYIIILLYSLVFLDIVLIVLSLSRSAWLAAAATLLFFAFFSFLKKEGKNTGGSDGVKSAAIVCGIAILSLAAVSAGKLSKFDIFDRARSTATSEQKITIACKYSGEIPGEVGNIEDLPKFGCRHINLEEIESYKSQGMFVTEIFRKDPNVQTRSVIYQKSWEEIKKHPVLGIGYGSMTQILGVDSRGAGLNESNIFLQVWAGSGILGLISFIILIGYIIINALRRISPICPMNKFIGCPVVKDNFEMSANLFLFLGIVALIIPNLFNAGLLLGLTWLAFSVFVCIWDLHA